MCDVGGGEMGLRRVLSDAVSSGGVTVIASSSPSFASGMMTDDDFGDGDNAITTHRNHNGAATGLRYVPEHGYVSCLIQVP